MKTRHGDWFLTYTGKQFYPLDARPEDIFIEDIAHALSMICRFGGHTRCHYSVAQHSCLVSDLLPPHLKLIGLMHDATEAYLGDLVRPLKYNIPVYREAEDALWLVIAERFNLPVIIPKEVKRVDNIALMTERRDFLISTAHKWSLEDEFPAHPTRLTPMSPYAAEQMFMTRWAALTQPRVEHKEIGACECV